MRANAQTMKTAVKPVNVAMARFLWVASRVMMERLIDMAINTRPARAAAPPPTITKKLFHWSMAIALQGTRKELNRLCSSLPEPISSQRGSRILLNFRYLQTGDIKDRSSSESESIEGEDCDVVVLSESLRLLSDALSCLNADFASAFETEELAAGALGFNHAVRKQREAIAGVERKRAFFIRCVRNNAERQRAGYLDLPAVAEWGEVPGIGKAQVAAEV